MPPVAPALTAEQRHASDRTSLRECRLQPVATLGDGTPCVPLHVAQGAVFPLPSLAVAPPVAANIPSRARRLSRDRLALVGERGAVKLTALVLTDQPPRSLRGRLHLAAGAPPSLFPGARARV